ncbi:hypothetical protein MLD38_033245 [Melastoma candidum]|uniref:Uncharacterized protein n=1 Tax=Melastoma candidum TaxID=119954 RepID=A0ACB9MAG6_9MYRT|nr:hypothetical protein MLD38_033245 [Melastoma candidum]
MSVTAGVSDTVIAIWDKLRGNIGQTKVKRQRLCLHSRRRAGGRTGRKLKLMKRIKDRNLLMRQEEVSLLPEEEEEEEEESEYETDSDEDAPDITMVKLVLCLGQRGIRLQSMSGLKRKNGWSRTS